MGLIQERLQSTMDHSGQKRLDDSRLLIRDAVRDAAGSLDRRPRVPAQIAGYRILRLLGRGGGGLVYQAEQQSPRRMVALKVLASESLTIQKTRRFSFEAEFLGRLQHPAIAHIYEAAIAETSEGRRPYLAMELIEGARSITRYAREARLGVRQKLELITVVCDAVEHAHQKGIIHRDLKPSNILVDLHGRPRIVDFGVARATDSDIEITTMATDASRLIGTIPYMSPEQASGNIREVDTRSDVYALGVVLYQLLAGRMPYSMTDKSCSQMLNTICIENPARLSTLERSLRGDVEVIVLTALEKDRARRYQSAAAFGDDIRRYLGQQAILARTPSKLYQIRTFANQHKSLVAGIAGVVLMLSLGLIGVLWQASRVEHETELRHQLLRWLLDVQYEEAAIWGTLSANIELLHELSDSAGIIFKDDPIYESRTRDMLGRVWLEIGEVDWAEAEFRRHLELVSDIHGPDNEKTLRAYDVLIDALRSSDKLEEAHDLINDALAVAGYGNGVVRDATVNLSSYTLALRVLRLRHKLAVTLHDLGHLDDSEQVYRTTLNELQHVLELTRWSPDDHDNVAEIRWDLATLILDHEDDLQDAVDLLESAVTFQNQFSFNHPNHALGRMSLAEALWVNGETERALDELERANKIELSATPTQRRTIEMRIKLVRGTILMATDARNAELLLRDALELHEKLEPGHWRTALTRAKYSECLALLGDIEDARFQLEAARKTLLDRFGEEDYRTQRVNEHLTKLHPMESGSP